MRGYTEGFFVTNDADNLEDAPNMCLVQAAVEKDGDNYTLKVKDHEGEVHSVGGGTSILQVNRKLTAAEVLTLDTANGGNGIELIPAISATERIVLLDAWLQSAVVSQTVTGAKLNIYVSQTSDSPFQDSLILDAPSTDLRPSEGKSGDDFNYPVNTPCYIWSDLPLAGKDISIHVVLNYMVTTLKTD